MAQKVQVLVVDDIDGSEATETVSFGLNDSWFARRGWHPGKLAGPRGVNPGKPRPPVHHATKAQNKIIAIPNGFSSFAVIQVGIKKGRPPVAKPPGRPRPTLSGKASAFYETRLLRATWRALHVHTADPGDLRVGGLVYRFSQSPHAESFPVAAVRDRRSALNPPRDLRDTMLTLAVICIVVTAIVGVVVYITRTVKPRRVKSRGRLETYQPVL